VGSLAELGCVGEKGEFYFHPSKKASLTLPKGLDKNQIEKRSLSVPIFPYSSILVPTGAEWLNVFEMKHRQLLNDLGPDALFGFVYFSTSQQKFGLVGTLARIKSRKLLDDGRVFVTVEGVDRFYLSEFYSEKPYLKARVKVLSDYSLIEESELDNIETQVFDELRTNLKLMEHIFPSKNYHISKQILQNRPSTFTTRIGDRAVKLQDQEQEMERRSRFSYAVLETLQVSSSMKLKLLQEHVIENRLSKFLEILRAGKDFLKEELVSKKGYTEDMCNQIVLQSKHQTDLDAELLSDSSAWSSGINFKGNRWNQDVVYMD
jgi:ATP-dependent Lon protease